MQNEKIQRDCDESRLEWEKSQEKIRDLEKWVVILTNNVYTAGDEASHQ